MAVINLSEIDEKRIEELAAKATLKGVLVDYVGIEIYNGEQPIGGYEYAATSASDPSRFHVVTVWEETRDRWFGQCDCEANQQGNHLCGHVAVAFIELKRELAKKQV